MAQDDLRRELARAERWAAILEQHGLTDTAHHQTAARLRAALEEAMAAADTADKQAIAAKNTKGHKGAIQAVAAENTADIQELAAKDTKERKTDKQAVAAENTKEHNDSSAQEVRNGE